MNDDAHMQYVLHVLADVLFDSWGQMSFDCLNCLCPCHILIYMHIYLMVCLYMFFPSQPSCVQETPRCWQIWWRGGGGQGLQQAAAGAERERRLVGREHIVTPRQTTLCFQRHQTHRRDSILSLQFSPPLPRHEEQRGVAQWTPFLNSLARPFSS